MRGPGLRRRRNYIVAAATSLRPWQLCILLAAAIIAVFGVIRALGMPFTTHRTRIVGAAVSTPPPHLPRMCVEPAWLAPAFRYLHTLQHGVSREWCRSSAARLMVAGEEDAGYGSRLSGPQLDISPREGFGSVMAVIARSLVSASSEGRTLVLNVANWSYGGDEDCMRTYPADSAAWNCVFLPLSPCTLADAIAAEHEDDVDPKRDGTSASWRRAYGRYVHKDYVRVPAWHMEGGRLDYPLRVPESVLAAGGAADDWLAAVRAYLVAHLTAPMKVALQEYKRRQGVQNDGGVTIGLHLRVQDRGDPRGIDAVWADAMRLVERALNSSAIYLRGTMSLLIATDSEDDDALARAIADGVRRGFDVSVVPRQFRAPGGVMYRSGTATWLRDHPADRQAATLDALAVVDALSQCDVIIGTERDSTLFQLAVSLQRARGCIISDGVPPVWTLDALGGGPIPPSLHEQRFVV